MKFSGKSIAAPELIILDRSEEHAGDGASLHAMARRSLSWEGECRRCGNEEAIRCRHSCARRAF